MKCNISFSLYNEVYTIFKHSTKMFTNFICIQNVYTVLSLSIDIVGVKSRGSGNESIIIPLFKVNMSIVDFIKNRFYK